MNRGKAYRGCIAYLRGLEIRLSVPIERGISPMNRGKAYRGIRGRIPSYLFSEGEG